MKKVDLSTATSHIKQACDENSAAGERLPFFFLVGSGISYPPVLLASKIEESCKVVAQQHNRGVEPTGKRMIDTYSHWFDQAYPHPVERQRYLRGLIEGKFISHANFRLAHLLLEKRIANLVITPNFDDFLSRALTLFGKPHIVCDHPRTVERINPEADDIQIVHVHGTYWFYDCCILTGEIEERSRPSPENSLTMASLLDTVLSRRAPLVVGYGGWEGDVVMCALKRRLQSRLPHNLYWFCYRESELAGLPDFLKYHPDVYFVVASAPSAGQSPASVNGAAERRPAAVAEEPPAADDEEGEPTLNARKVFDKLIEVFSLSLPELTRDPLGYFAEYLKRSLPQQDDRSSESDSYSLASVIERIESARVRARVKGTESKMEQVRDRLRRSHYRDALRLGAEMAGAKLPASQARELLRTMLTAAWRLDDDSADEVQGYDLVVKLADSIEHPDGYVRERVAMALVNKGLALAGANRHKEAIATFDEVVRRFGKDRETFFSQQTAEAIFNKGYSLSALGRHEQANEVYGQLIGRLNQPTEPELQEMLGMALINQGYTWGELNQSDKELKAYDEVVKRLGGSEDPEVMVQVAQALYNKGMTLKELNRSKAAGRTFRELIGRFEGRPSQELRELVENARASLLDTTGVQAGENP